ncbi:MAG TPA: PSD1 and planctomycete cytochrome C domain-containing protein, partial [Prosthecobacter sp.]|nr:PSD1 and planctomycete cytochrome C domain-containing protein [Prosthecobacter sp.]
MPPRFLLLSALLTATIPVAAAVDYTAAIKPLLKEHCVKCHGSTTQKGGLRLDTAAAALNGGGRGPAIVPGRGEESLLIQAIQGAHAEIPQMPYKRGPLESVQMALVKQWIDEGAKAPADEIPSDDRHWAYRPPVRPAVPKLSRQPANPIDAFVISRLEQEELKLSPPAAPETQVRRVSLDLTGLPPRADAGPTASYDRLVNELLTSPHYGERWGRWWLDQARYADSNGYSIDAPRSMWPYRDWVISALNKDMPFDRFSIEQLAGDMLPGATRAQQIATGFHRNTQINQEGGIDKEQFRIESVFDRVATTGTVWLGLTIGCAQCHDHKFDAISHKEYYSLFAFLNNQDEPTLPVPDAGQDPAKLQKEQKQLEEKVLAYIRKHQGTASEWEGELSEETKKRLNKEAQKALTVAAEKRTPAQLRALFAAGPGAADQEFRAVNEQLTEVERLIRSGVTTLVMKELPKPRKTTLFIKGDFTRPADEMRPAVPAILHPLRVDNPTRLDLAKWLVSRDNPLTARVIVNRIWQQYFGRGLVETENDFGTMGRAPTHPELLDWLAVEFMDSGWSLKHMHRLIVTSQTYRQSSRVEPAIHRKAQAVDPNNYLLWRQNRLRLDAEIVRDVCLTASGLLAPQLGGPPVYPPIPEGVLSLGQVKRTWPLSKGSDRYRRGLYTFIFRATPPPALGVFDAPEGFSTCTRRLRSNTPLQALTLLNDAAFVEFAQALEKIIRREGIETAFRNCTARAPSAEER